MTGRPVKFFAPQKQRCVKRIAFNIKYLQVCRPDKYDGDIIVSAVLVGRFDQFLTGLGQFTIFADNLQDLTVLNQITEAIGAE